MTRIRTATQSLAFAGAALLAAGAFAPGAQAEISSIVGAESIPLADSTSVTATETARSLPPRYSAIVGLVPQVTDRMTDDRSQVLPAGNVVQPSFTDPYYSAIVGDGPFRTPNR